MNTTGSSALRKRVKTTVGLSPSKGYANITRKSYFPSDQEMGMGTCNICSQDRVYVKFHVY